MNWYFLLFTLAIILAIAYKNKINKQLSSLVFKTLKWQYIRRCYFGIASLAIGTKEKIKRLLAEIFESIGLTIILFIVFIGVLFWIIPPSFSWLTEENLSCIGIWFSLAEFSDRDILELLKFVVSASIAGLPLSLTFYYFYYREQKSISESAVIRNSIRIPCIMGIFCFFFMGVYSSLLAWTFSNSMRLVETVQSKLLLKAMLVDRNISTLEIPTVTPLAISVAQQNRLFITLCLFALSISFALMLLKKLLSSINISWLLSCYIEEIKILLCKLLIISSKDQYICYRENIYNKSMVLVESIYQMLIGTVEKNISVVYSENIVRWMDILTFLYRRGKVAPYGDLLIRYVYLFKTDTKCYTELYRTILRNHLLLIIALYNKNKQHDGYMCIRYFLLLNPRAIYGLQRSNDLIITEYFAALHDMSVFLLKSDAMAFRKLLSDVQGAINEKAEIINLMMLFKALMVKAVRDDDLKLITELAYALRNFIENISDDVVPNQAVCEEIVCNEEVTDQGVSNLEGFISLSYYAQKMSGTIGKKKYEGIALYLLMQATIKSIELSHYGLTGFLIKHIISNFESERIEKVHNSIKIKNGIRDDILETGGLFDKINIAFNIDANTAIYCVKKLTVLLYLQQRYRCENPIQAFRCMPKEFLTTSNIVHDDINYLFVKLQSVNSQYGLLSVSEKSFFDRIKQELISTYKVAEEVYAEEAYVDETYGYI